MSFDRSNMDPNDGDKVPLYVRHWCKQNCPTYGECKWLKKNCPYYTTPQWMRKTEK